MSELEESTGERATIHAVASRAGVSPTTASLVLAGKGGSRRISAITHRRVQQAAEDLNYSPNLGIRALRGERTNILSFFNAYRNRDRNDLYMKAMSSAVEEAGGAEGYDILVHCNYERSPKEMYQFLNGNLTDGLILFAPRPDDPLLELLRKGRLPVVIINATDQKGQYSSVADDVVQGMRILADEIVAQGHRKVAALIDFERKAPDSDIRIRLLRSFLADYGIELPDSRLIPSRESTVQESLAAIRAMDERPTVVFCWHDRLAYAFLSACESQGLSVPGDLSVVGYDGLHWPSRTSHVATSAQVDFQDLALTAVRLLDRVIKQPDAPVQQLTIPVTYHRGSSLGPPSAMEQSL